ncbi:MAG: ribonuclease HII [Thermoplasmata archaeon]|nr:ribonuclease HII [Thermoplasmata archaeon]MCI4341766.1 ribonuclease HII [Thermoplasmata archaeon]
MLPPTHRERRRAGGARTVLGLDEAGRGSVLGPLVIGGLLVAEDRLAELRPMGVRDSKRLTPRRRAELFDRIAEVGERASVRFEPGEIDAAVRHHRLNHLEALGFAALVRRMAPDRVVVDACDPVAARFGRHVQRLSGGRVPVEARHHADAQEPVVGAASIVAKVLRDRAMLSLSEELGYALGSGYPSDPRTIEVLRAALAAEGRPSWVRHSWRTAERVKAGPWVETLETYAP